MSPAAISLVMAVECLRGREFEEAKGLFQTLTKQFPLETALGISVANQYLDQKEELEILELLNSDKDVPFSLISLIMIHSDLVGITKHKGGLSSASLQETLQYALTIDPLNGEAQLTYALTVLIKGTPSVLKPALEELRHFFSASEEICFAYFWIFSELNWKIGTKLGMSDACNFMSKAFEQIVLSKRQFDPFEPSFVLLRLWEILIEAFSKNAISKKHLELFASRIIDHKNLDKMGAISFVIPEKKIYQWFHFLAQNNVLALNCLQAIKKCLYVCEKATLLTSMRKNKITSALYMSRSIIHYQLNQKEEAQASFEFALSLIPHLPYLEILHMKPNNWEQLSLQSRDKLDKLLNQPIFSVAHILSNHLEPFLQIKEPNFRVFEGSQAGVLAFRYAKVLAHEEQKTEPLYFDPKFVFGDEIVNLAHELSTLNANSGILMRKLLEENIKKVQQVISELVLANMLFILCKYKVPKCSEINQNVLLDISTRVFKLKHQQHCDANFTKHSKVSSLSFKAFCEFGEQKNFLLEFQP